MISSGLCGDDGIDVGVPGTTVTRNTANDNHDLGIAAVPGVIDGGGNRAAGNGNPPVHQPRLPVAETGLVTTETRTSIKDDPPGGDAASGLIQPAGSCPYART